MGAREVVERYVDEVLNGAVPPDELVADEELRQRVAGFQRAFPDLVVETKLLLAEGDLVAVHLVGRGTHEGLYQGVPATGRTWEARCTAVYRVSDGRVVDAWVSWDLLSIMEQLGAIERVAGVSA